MAVRERKNAHRVEHRKQRHACVGEHRHPYVGCSQDAQHHHKHLETHGKHDVLLHYAARASCHGYSLARLHKPSGVTYDFEEDTICKGAFYVLPPEYSYDLEDTPPEKGIIKGVFTCDYTKQGNGIRIHRFTLSYETADNITVRKPVPCTA